MLGSKFSNFHGRSFFHTYTLHTCFNVHSPYIYLVYTLQAQVRFNIFGFSRDFILFILTISTHNSEFTLHAVALPLSKQMLHFKILELLSIFFLHAYALYTCFSVHSPNSFMSTLFKQMFGLHSFCLIFTGIHFSMLLLSIQILGFT